MVEQLQAGVAREVITPPIGIMLAGALRDRPAAGVERDLTVTALVLSHCDNKVALIACDLMRLSPAHAGTLRASVGAALGIEASEVLINTSHTHATPDAPMLQDYDDNAKQVNIARAYWEDVDSRIIKAVRVADGRRQSVRMGVGVGGVGIGVNRREQLDDGARILGENPNGVIDPSVGVARFDGADGPVALLLTYACHPDILGPKCDLISPDYVGAARETAEAITGATTLFFQGPAGDIDPRCGIVLGSDGLEEINRLGAELGCEGGRIFHSINTRRRRDRRIAWRSGLAVVTAWTYGPILQPSTEFLGIASRKVGMPLRPLPDETSAQRSQAAAESALKQMSRRESTLSERLVARRAVRWADLQLESIRKNARPVLDVELQVIRVNDLVLVGVPGELFVEIGLAIKARCRSVHTFVLGYSNGTHFYIPTAAAFRHGGYEIEAHRNYHQAAGPTPEWEEILPRVAAELVESLT